MVKNTLALRAAQDTEVANLRDQFQGPTAVAYSLNDPVGLAKVLADFLKKHPDMSFKGGVVESHPVTADQIKELAGI